jgi:serine/threonine protein kinase
VQVFGFERIDGRPALILEYVDGVSLALFSQSCLLANDEVEEVLAQLEVAVLDLYKAGVFHGDLSPHNILIDGEGRLRLLDFGLANCAGGDIRLTPEFAAPERHAGSPANLTADIFSIGRIEQFLRGQKFAPDRESPYLCLNPQKRSLRGHMSDNEVRAKLGSKIQLLQKHRRLARELSTRTIQRRPLKQRNPLFVGIVAACLLMSASSASPRTKTAEVLQIRTMRWHYFILDGNPIGYSPISIPLQAGRPYRLEWISAHGKGAKTVTVKAHAPQMLQDRDFSH